MQKVIWLIVAVVIIGGLFVLGRVGGPKGEDFSKEFANQGQEHIAEDATHPEYNSNPPSSGWHYVTPAVPGFYAEALPDERVVHNLEHGHIWIAYRPDLDEALVSEIRMYASPIVIITPRAENDTDIALVAWTRVDAFDIDEALPTSRIDDFITRYKNRGPEKVPATPHFNE